MATIAATVKGEYGHIGERYSHSGCLSVGAAQVKLNAAPKPSQMRLDSGGLELLEQKGLLLVRLASTSRSLAIAVPLL